MTELKRRTIAAFHTYGKIQKWKMERVSHVHCRAYVLAKVAQKCLVVVYPFFDSEPQLVGLDYGARMVHRFHESLNTGDWCAIAYVSSGNGWGETVAIPAVQ